MTPGDLFAKLWERARTHAPTQPLAVFYVSAVGGFEENKQGVYSPPAPKNQTPKINIFRTPLPIPHTQPDLSDPQQAIQDACTLAHEFGHRQSHLAGRPAYDVAAAVPFDQRATMADNLKQAILDEETLAWRLGRQALQDLGCDDLTAFDERERDALATYRDQLGLP